MIKKYREIFKVLQDLGYGDKAKIVDIVPEIVFCWLCNDGHLEAAKMLYNLYSKGLCIESKSPTNHYVVSNSQKEMKQKYMQNGYTFVLSNDYDKISKEIHAYLQGTRLLCKYCTRCFHNMNTLQRHYQFFHRINI